MLTFRLNDTEIPAAALIHGLYHATEALGMGKLHDNPDLSVVDVENYLDGLTKAPDSLFSKFSLDYFHGRPLKISFEKEDHTRIDERSIRLYDRDAGPGTFMRVVESIIGSEEVPS